MACAPASGELSRYFAARKLSYDPRLVRTGTRNVCHVFYQPSLPGFRAAPDNAPVSELFLDLLLPGFLSLRTERYGDPLDIARQMLPLIPRPIRVNLGMPQNQERRYYDQAIQFHFAATPHTFAFRENQWDQKNPWVQDYLKAGSAAGEGKILVTRLAFEGRRENGPLMKPMLDSLFQGRFVRSNLSWDGGDLQFVRSPRDPLRLLMIYGRSARKYWGGSLSPAEFEYVLKVEFGADEAVDFTDLTSHVDYSVAFLPEDNIALVSQPERNNFEIARAAAALLVRNFIPHPPPEAVQLESLLAHQETAFLKDPGAVRRLLDRIRERSPGWKTPLDPRIERRIADYTASACSGLPMDCASPDGIARLLANDRALLRDWSRSAIAELSSEALAPRLASLIESQLPDFRGTIQPVVDGNARELEALGFRVIRIPRLAGDPALTPRWPGISYANATLIDRTLFMPEFGLGEPEWALFDRMRAVIPSKYRLVPVYARHVLLYNGGIHCLSGLIRERDGMQPGAQNAVR